MFVTLEFFLAEKHLESQSVLECAFEVQSSPTVKRVRKSSGTRQKNSLLVCAIIATNCFEMGNKAVTPVFHGRFVPGMVVLGTPLYDVAGTHSSDEDGDSDCAGGCDCGRDHGRLVVSKNDVSCHGQNTVNNSGCQKSTYDRGAEVAVDINMGTLFGNRLPAGTTRSGQSIKGH